MSIDFSAYPASELDQALSSSQLQQSLPHQQAYDHRDRYAHPPTVQGHGAYDLYSNAQSSSSSFSQPRYRPQSAASPSLDNHAHAQQQHAYSHDFLYPHASSVYSDTLQAAESPSNPFEMLSGLPHASATSLPTSSMQAHPYQRHGPAYAYPSALPTLSPNAVNAKQHDYLQQQESYNAALMTERRQSAQTQDYPDQFGLPAALDSSLSQTTQSMNQYHERPDRFQSEPLYPSTPLSVPSQPMKTEYRNDSTRGFDHLRFASPSSPTDLGLGSMSVMTVDETLSKMKLQPNPTPTGADLVTFVRSVT